MKKRSDYCLDGFCFFALPNECQNEIVRIANIFQAAKVWVMAVTTRQLTPFLFQLFDERPVSLLACFPDTIIHLFVSRVGRTFRALCVTWDEHIFDKYV